MDQNIENKEKIIYKELMKLEDGTNSDRSLAFECTGILGNESTEASFEKRLEIVENLIKKHLEKNSK